MKKRYGIIAIFILLYTRTTIVDEPVQVPTEKEFDEIIYNWTRTFAHVLQLAKEKHFKVRDLEKGMINAIDAFLTSLDPHSSFLDPKTYKMMMQTTSGEFFGIGIVIDNTRKPKDKFLIVIDTIPDGPSDQAGLMPMDKIIEINGKSLEGMSTEEATSTLKGERNTTVNIKVMRENHQDLISFDITRDVIKEQNSLSFFIKDHNIYYLSLSTFSDNAVKQMRNLLEKARKHKYRGIVLDLRNNSGGLLTAAIDIASLFLEKGSLVVVTKDKAGNEIDRYSTNKDPIADNATPIFILTNNYTASAAEILAGALKIHSEKYAQDSKTKEQKLPIFLVGTKTFGKGSVQEVIPVNNNSALKMTTSLYYLPNNTTIQGISIHPDFVIEKTFPPTEQMLWFTKNYGREAAFDNYIKATENDAQTKKDAEEQKKKDGKKNKNKRWNERAKEMLQSDNQLRETVSLINLLHTAKTLCPKNVNNRDKAVAFLKQNHITNDTMEIEEIKA
jgi:carboxyl-terminal processing protease